MTFLNWKRSFSKRWQEGRGTRQDAISLISLQSWYCQVSNSYSSAMVSLVWGLSRVNETARWIIFSGVYILFENSYTFHNISLNLPPSKKFLLNFFWPSHMLNNNICGNFLISVFFILLLQMFFFTKLVLKTGSYKYQKEKYWKYKHFEPILVCCGFFLTVR